MLKRRRVEGARVRADLAEAALNAGFALVRLAGNRAGPGARGDAQRALREAVAACSESEGRLFGASRGDSRRIRRRLEELRGAIGAARAGLRRTPARVIRMPAPSGLRPRLDPRRG